MALNLLEWATRQPQDRPEDASVVVFGMSGPRTIDVLLCYARAEGDSSSKVAWAALLAIEATEEGTAIPTPMADVVRNTVFTAKRPGERWSEVPARLWKDLVENKGMGSMPTAVVGLVPKHHAIDLAFSDLADFIEGRTGHLADVDDTLVGMIDLAIRSLTDADTDKRTTLDTLAERFFNRPPRGHDYFDIESLGNAAAKAGEELFAEGDPEKMEELLTPIFRLGFHLRQDTYGPFPWTLVRDGVNADAVIHRVPDSNTLLAYLFPACPEPPLVCAYLLSMDVRDTSQGKPATVCLAAHIARLQDGCETEGA